MRHVLTRTERIIASTAFAAVLTYAAGAVAAPATAQQMAAVRAHCTRFAAGNAHITATPKAFCGCFLGMVHSKFKPADRKIMLSAMAGTPATDKGEWNWPRSPAMKTAMTAAHLSKDEARASYKRMMKRLTPVMPRCAAAESHAEAAQSGGAPQAAADAKPCTSKDCFSDRFAACEPAVYTTRSAMGGRARYEVKGRDGARCRVRMWYTANPNPAWVDKPLSMALDPASPFDAQMKKAMQTCLAQDKPGRYACKGPLRGIAAN
jgi:hypothetical protein